MSVNIIFWRITLKQTLHTFSNINDLNILLQRVNISFDHDTFLKELILGISGKTMNAHNFAIVFLYHWGINTFDYVPILKRLFYNNPEFYENALSHIEKYRTAGRLTEAIETSEYSTHQIQNALDILISTHNLGEIVTDEFLEESVQDVVDSEIVLTESDEVVIDFDHMSFTQLKSYAVAQGLDISGAKTKKQILAILKN